MRILLSLTLLLVLSGCATGARVTGAALKGFGDGFNRANANNKVYNCTPTFGNNYRCQ